MPPGYRNDRAVLCDDEVDIPEPLVPRDRRPHVSGVPFPRGFGEAVRSAFASEKSLLAKVDQRIDDKLRDAALSLSSLAVPCLWCGATTG